jgi:hypothetical protein
LQHLSIPKVQDPKTLAAEPGIPRLVLIFIFFGVLPAVDFDHQAPVKGHEINEIIADGFLSPKLNTCQLVISQMEPKAVFNFGCPPS